MPNFAPINLNEISPKVADIHALLQVALPTFQLNPNELSQRLAGESTRQGLTDLLENLGQNELTIPTDGNLLKPETLKILDNVVVLSGAVNTYENKPFPHKIYQAYNVTFAGMGILNSLDTKAKIEANASDFFPIGNAPSKSDDNGQFKVVFSKAESRENVVVFAFNEDGGIIGKSKLATKADLMDKLELPNFNVSLNKGIEAPKIEVASEFEIVKKKIEAIASLDKIQSDEQWNFIAQETGIELAKIQTFRQANTFDADHSEVLYGMGRSGIDISHNGIAFSNEASQNEAVNKAVADGLITKPMIPPTDLLAGLNKKAYLETLKLPDGKPSQIGGLLGLNLENDDLKAIFLNHYAESQYNPTEMWEKLALDDTIKDKVPALKLTNELFSLTGGNLDLTSKLAKEHNVTDLKKVMEMDLGTIIPETMNLEEKAGYVKGIQDTLTELYPTTRYRLKSDAFRLDNHVTKLLATDKYDFKTTDLFTLQNLVSELKDEQGNPLIQQADKNNVVNTLATSQRLFQVSSSFEDFENLHKTKFTSALQIANLPEKEFVLAYLQVNEDEKTAKQIYANARELTALTETAILAINDAISAEGIAAIGGFKKEGTPTTPLINTDATIKRSLFYDLLPHLRTERTETTPPGSPSSSSTATTEPSPDGVKRLPNYQDFFGTLSNCECKDCRSIYSPAAYLVDTLQFLGEPARTALFARRPDIGHIPLTCENTNIIIPYIDLVNEIMEYYVVHNTLNDDSIDKKMPHDTGEATTIELRAEPHQTTEAAYEKLSTDYSSFNLPYHRPLDQIRSYLPQLKTSRYELIEVFGGDNKELALVKEYFNLSDKEYDIIISKPELGISDYYNSTISDLKLVKTFLEKTKIHFTDLVELTITTYHNPNNVKDIITSEEQCNLDKMKFSFSDDNSFMTFLMQAKTFIRLWRKSGITIHELDVLLSTVQVVDNIEQSLTNLYKCLKLNETLKLPIPQLACLWGDIDTYGDKKSLYSKLFLNRFVQKLDVGGDFKLDKINTPSTLKLADHRQIICYALQLNAETFDSILAELKTDNTLTIANLSVVYRYVLLAKVLKISVLELIILKKLYELDILSKEPKHLIDFITKVQQFQELGFKPKQIESIFTTTEDKPEVAVIFNDKLLTAIKVCRDGFAQIDLENPEINFTDSSVKGTIKSSEINTDFVTNKLAILFGNDIAQKFVGLFNGNTVFSIQEAKNLVISIDDNLKNKLLYDKVTGILSTKGIIKEADKSKIVGFSGEIINKLFDKFKSFIVENAIAHLFANEAERNDLLSLDGIVSNEPYISIYEKLLPLLRKNLKDVLVYGAFSKIIEMESPIANMMLKSSIENLKKLVIETGLSSDDLIAREIKIDSVDTAVKRTWRGYICPIKTDDYTFIVEVAQIDEDFSLIIDGVKANDKTNGETTVMGNWKMEAGKFYSVAIHYKNNLGEAGIDLYWKSNAMTKQIVPTDVLQPQNKFDEIKKISETTQKKGLLIKGLQLTPDEVYYWTTTFPKKIEFNSIADIPPLFEFITFRKQLPQKPISLATFISIESQIQKENKNEILSQITGWDKSWIEAQSITDYTLSNLIALHKKWLLCHTTQQTVTQLTNCTNDLSFDDLNKTAQEIINAVKATFEDPDLWLEFAPTLNNPIRERQRDALIAYLLPVMKKKDADELYEYFLIDVQMGAKMDTSRIKQAISSVQLFVQRCLLNLELGVSPTQISTENKRWEWQKNYRLWEANRKIFTYPENWIEPEYRDNKSPFFKELESDLLQNDITDENVEKALREYVYKLNEVAHLDICGVHQEEGDNGKIHVVARTHAAPYQYFYRTTTYPTLDWTAWEKVPVDIKGVEDGANSGVHLLPVVFQGRTYLFWPEFMEKVDENSIEMTIPPIATPKTFTKPKKYWEVRLAWSEYKDKKWSPKQISKDHITLKYDRFIEKLKQYQITAMPLNSPEDIFTEELNLSFTNFENYQETFFFNVNNVIGGIGGGGSLYTTLKKRFQSNEALNSFFYESPKTYFKGDFKGITTFANNKTESENMELKVPFYIQDSKRIYFVKPDKGNRIIGRGLLQSIWPIEGLSFHNFYHPFTSEFLSAINKKGIDGIMEEDTNKKYEDNQKDFETTYQPNENLLITPYPLKNIDFSQNGGYSIYNWELFFHAPLFIANRLSKNGKYKEAMHWFHYIFDPTTNELPNPANTKDNKRFWKVKGFKDILTPNETLEEFFLRINNEGKEGEVNQWLKNPFNAHSVARNRKALPYMKNVLLKYIENLTAWGDDLFRQDSMESINEATQLYVIAGHLLGKRPEYIPELAKPIAKSYNKLVELRLGSLSDAYTDFQNIFPTINIKGASGVVGEAPPKTSTGPIGDFLYFGIPFNKNILKHWDNVEDRLFKIRHSMNIEGVERSIDLFGSPIDPGMLAAAAGKGLSLTDILSDLNTPAPMYRFNYLMQKAVEFTGEVKALGGAILSAIEKGDAEKLSLMRASHESTMINLVTGIKERQVLEAKANRQNLEVTRKNTKKRIAHYMGLMGIAEADYTIPDLVTLSSDLNADSTLPADSLVKEEPLKVNVSLSNSKETGVMLIPREADELQSLYRAKVLQADASAYELLASIYGMFPNIAIDAKPVGVGGGATFGGSQFAAIYSAAARITNITAANHSYNANNAAKMASYIRRVQDWTFQLNSAAREIVQVDKQIVAADIRIQIAQKELSNHLQQIKHTEEVEAYLKDKFTNQELYTWMKEQLMSIYKLSYQMAYDLAKKAEKAYRFEIGKQQSDFIKYGYFDSNFKGLLAGEKLHFALKQLDKAYIEENVRRLELTKHISLRNIAPKALLNLINQGECEFDLEEWLFDLDFAGHYFRTIKSVALSIPCVAGPYTTINCTLRLQKNSIRINTNNANSYPRKIDEDDDRFIENLIPFKSIATSTAQNDSGMFEVNFRDERYLPFEGSGAISKWKLELGSIDHQQFDYKSIADVVMHVKYTAREEGGTFKGAAISSIDELIKGKSIRMFNVKQDFPNEWHTYKNNEAGGLKFTIIAEHLPFWAKGQFENIEADLFDGDGKHKSNISIETHKISITEEQVGGNETLFLILKIK